MATINGIGFKGVKTFTGREGHGFTANVYLNNKKVGMVADYANGGPLDIDIEPKHREAVMAEINAYLETEKTTVMLDNEEDFFNALFTLYETEKTYKSNSKKGFGVLSVFHYVPKDAPLSDPRHMKYPEMRGFSEISVVEEFKQKFKPVYTEDFTALEQFNIVQK